MHRSITKLIVAALAGLLAVLPALAQDGTYSSYSPYTVFGIGDLAPQGNVHTRTMGGVGIASRDRRYINPLNPAAITARDTLAFMADFGVIQKNTVFRQGDLKSANNIFNINNFSITVPIWKKSAMILGLAPYASVGYDFSQQITDPSLIGRTGNVSYDATGDGGLYQVYLGGAATFWDRLSIGAEFIYYFGNITREATLAFDDLSYRDIQNSYEISMHGPSGKVGVQYEQPIGNVRMTLGATYKLPAWMLGEVHGYSVSIAASQIDTLSTHHNYLGNSRDLRLASEYGAGLSVRRPEHWSAEVNYTYSDWRSSGLDCTPGFSTVSSVTFLNAASQSVRAGFEFIPNRNDLRYYMNTCTYRVGGYYETSYFLFNGNPVTSYGLTFGITLPVFRWHNGVTLGADIGRRGSLNGGMTRETYALFVIGISLHDVWFMKQWFD